MALAARAREWHRDQGREIPIAYIVKDFWVTEALRSLAQHLHIDATTPPRGVSSARVIFKGGTSLSKAYGLIDRFSEDIDLYVVTRFTPAGEGGVVAPGGDFADDPVGNNRADSLFARLAARVAEDVGKQVVASEDKPPRKGSRRAYEVIYADPAENLAGSAALKQNVLIELTRMGNPEPNVPEQLSSLIADYALRVGLGAEFVEFEPVTIDVLAPHRTLIEKLCAVEGCAGRTDADRFSGMARHFYDIYRLLGADSVRDSLTADSIGAEGIAADHVARSASVRRATGARPDTGFADSTWIQDEQARDAARDAYDREVGLLVYGDVPTFAEVIDRVAEHRDLL
jgi:hypothetical protein